MLRPRCSTAAERPWKATPMAVDMLDPGEELSPGVWQFPFWPSSPGRHPRVGHGGAWPVGLVWQPGGDGQRRRIDVTPTHPVLGRRMVREDVPTLPPG